MIPVIFNIGPIPINSFGLMIALMFLASIYLLASSLKFNEIDPKYSEIFVFAGVVSGLLGARIWFIIENYSLIKDDLFGAVFSGAGFTFYGGFVLALLVLFLLCRFYKIPSYKLYDSLGPTLALGYAIGRLGCQLSGDGDYGIETDTFIGMSYLTGIVPTPPGVNVYPTPLFESAISLVICFYLLNIERTSKWQMPWQRFGFYLILISIERFFIEFIRVKERYAFGLSEAHYFSMLFAAIGLYLVLRSHKHNGPLNEVAV